MPELDLAHCIPEIPQETDFNLKARIPFGVTVKDIETAMVQFAQLTCPRKSLPVELGVLS